MKKKLKPSAVSAPVIGSRNWSFLSGQLTIGFRYCYLLLLINLFENCGSAKNSIGDDSALKL